MELLPSFLKTLAAFFGGPGFYFLFNNELWPAAVCLVLAVVIIVSITWSEEEDKKDDNK